jgi:hypothetical protein
MSTKTSLSDYLGARNDKVGLNFVRIITQLRASKTKKVVPKLDAGRNQVQCDF